MSREAISMQMAELEARQFVASMQYGQEQGYKFYHTLIQKVIYNTLLKRDRQRVHTKSCRGD